MRAIGLVGGIGPESTIDYYRAIVARSAERGGDRYPPVLINSIDADAMLQMCTEGRLAELADYLLRAVGALARAGAQLAGFAANTPHLVFDAVRDAAPVPLVSLVEATADAARQAGLKRLGLLGTRYTMEAPFYPDVFRAGGMEIVVPPPADARYVHDVYFGELVRGVFRPESREGLIAVIDRLRTGDGIDAVVLGGTELPLLLRDTPYPLPLLDTTRLHVDALVSRSLASEA